MNAVVLKQGRERSLLRRHPWVFSGAIRSVRGDPQPGATVEVLDSSGRFLARGAYSPQSQIAIRIWTWDQSESVDPRFFFNRLAHSISARPQSTIRNPKSAIRYCNAESDFLPGLVVDRYGEFLVCQFLTTGVEFWKSAIVENLSQLTAARGIYERSDVDVREKEGLALASGVLWGEAPPDLIEIDEYGARFLVDVKRGHKTGFYLDQRENRWIVGELSAGREALNCFAYTGAFSIAALKGGAVSVTNVEASSSALDLARRNVALNGLEESACEFVEADVFATLRRFREAGRSFDLVLLDPPKFAPTAAQAEKAARAYKDINLLGFKLLRPNGLLVTFSCSGGVSAELFQKSNYSAPLPGD